MDNNVEPRYTIEALTAILDTFTLLITEENGFTPTQEFLDFLNTHLLWLSSLVNDWGLYDFRNKSYLTQLKHFLTEPNSYFTGCITWWDQFMDIALGFQSIFLQRGARPINSLTFDRYHELNEQFADIVSDLNFVLDRIPSHDYETMHENNRLLYYELNKYILNPDRVEKMSSEYGLDTYDYLDAIAV